MKKVIVITLCLLGCGFLQARAADAKANWEANCQKCHGADGKGATTMGKKLGLKDYTDAKVQADIKDDAAIKAIKDGVKDKDGKEVMKGSSGTLSDDEVKALLAYIRAFKKS